MNYFYFIIMVLYGCSFTEPQAHPPSDRNELRLWLSTGMYRDWSGEKEVVMGDNGAPRRLFGNDIFIENLESEDDFFEGAAAIREMYEKDNTTLRGVSMLEKRGKNGHPTWTYTEYFLENDTFSVDTPSAPGCVFCHAAGKDFVMSDAHNYQNRK